MKILFGETLLKLGFITQEQLEEALTMQKQGHAEMGRVMQHLKLLTFEQIEEILAFQRSESGRNKPFGVCAVMMGIITEKHRAIAINFQFTSRGVLGDILIELGYLTEEQREEANKQQFTI